MIGDDDPITDNPAALGPAGPVHCTMASWAAFATAVLDGLQGKDSPVLGAALAGWRGLSAAGGIRQATVTVRAIDMAKSSPACPG